MTNFYLNLYYRTGFVASLTTFLLVISSSIFAQAPQISSFSPTSGTTGSSVIITGSNFGTTPSSNVVYFGGVKANVTLASATSITVTVPKGATLSPITITSNSYTASSTKPFIVTFAGGNYFGYNGKKDYDTGSTKDTFQVKNTTLADLDLDGKIDLIANNFHGNTLAIFKNTSDLSGGYYNLSLSPRMSYLTNANPSNVSVGDLDSDGKLDLIIPNFGASSISILRNTSVSGTISFSSKQNFTTGSSPRIASVVDIDGDGKLDIAVVNEQSSSISIFRNTTIGSNISFATKVDVYTYSTNPRDLRFSDFDNDGKVDFVTSDFGSGTVTFFRNTSTAGSINVTYHTSIYTGGSPRSSAVADFDGDGKIDLAVANYSSSTIQIYKNQSTAAGSISFNSGTSIYNMTNAYGVTAGDINGDGKIDLAVANNTATGGFTLVKNVSISGSILFNSQISHPASEGTTFVTFGDLDGDSNPELIASNYFTNNISILSQGATTLPLDLLSFDGNIDENNKANLRWETSNEKNISHFIVEHSLDNVYDSIGTLTPGKNKYILSTEKLFNGNNYYRLKIVDNDGSVSYSKVVKLSKRLIKYSERLSIYPNPSYIDITIEHPLINKQATIDVLDVLGKNVIHLIISNNESKTNLNVSNLTAGTYIVQWTDGNQKLVHKLVKE